MKVRHSVFSPDGDGRADRVDLHYRFSEPAYAVLYVDGKRMAQAHAAPVGDVAVVRDGRLAGRAPARARRPGSRRQIAGSTRAFPVRLRYVELFQRRYRARGGTLRVRVSTDVKTVRGGSAGSAGPVHRHVFTILCRATGPLHLTVTANGHRARATVVVRE